MTHRSWALAVALATAGCGQDSLPAEETAVLAQAETVYPPPTAPLKAADMVNWRAAATPTRGTDPRSDFMRAQSLMSKLSSAAYENQAEFDQRVNYLGFVGQHLNGNAGRFSADAYVGSTERLGMMFVAVRGTSNVADFLTDIFNVPVVTNGAAQGTVHGGFALYADALYDQLRPVLDVSCNPNLEPNARLPLWLTGHSLGGAAASLLAERLQRDGCNVAGVALFGSPRPGLADFQRAYSETVPPVTQRWYNKRDPIYCLPPGGAWRHVGVENTLSDGIHLATGTNEGQCESPESTIGYIKNTLAGIDPVSAGAAYIAQALHDWLDGKFNLGFLCRDDTHWDAVYSLGLCEITDYGFGVASVYNISPVDLLTAAINLTMLKNHGISNYTDALEADFSEPQVPWVKVRLIIPAADPTPTFTEEYYHGVCTPEPLGDGSFFCDFDAPVGYAIRITSDVPMTPRAGQACDIESPGWGEPFVCELNVTGATEIPLMWNYVI